MKRRIEIDLERCIMAGECIYNHPTYFEFGPDDLPVVLRPQIDTDDDLVHAEQAMSVCPSGAISLVET